MLPVDSSRRMSRLNFPRPTQPTGRTPCRVSCPPSTGSKVVFSSRWTTGGFPIGRRLKLPLVDQRAVSDTCIRLPLGDAAHRVRADRSRSILDVCKARPTSSYVI